MTSRIIHSGLLPELRKRVDDLQPLGDLLALGFARRFAHLDAQLLRLSLDVDVAQQLADGLRAHLGAERADAVLVHLLAVLRLAQQLASLERRHVRGSVTT